MKRLILIIMLVLPTLIFSQELINYTEVVEVNNVEKSELFVRGREWFNDNFKSSKDVLQISDKETGELVGKAYLLVDCTYTLMGKKVTVPAGVYFQVSIWVKDGKYKYEFKNFNSPGSNDMSSLAINIGYLTTSDETNMKFKNLPKKRMNEIYLSVKNNTTSEIEKSIKKLKDKMAKNSGTTNW